MRKRLLLICRHDYWPGLTPDKVWELDFDLWPTLALACDARLKAQEEADREHKRQMARLKR